MSVVEILDVTVHKNPAPYLSPFEFEITFECREQLRESSDLEWKIIYVGSAESDEHDQELDSILVGPVPVGTNKFSFTAGPPDVSKVPANDVLGVTVVLLTCSFMDKEFIRVGYYVNNEYADEALKNDQPPQPVYEKIVRQILADKPKVTRFQIDWQDPGKDPYLKDITEIGQGEAENEETMDTTAAAGKDDMEEDEEDEEEDEANAAGEEDLGEEDGDEEIDEEMEM